MARVFVSHAGDGSDQAREVHRWLVEAGHEVFLDRDRRDGILVGEQWRQRLHERLRWADAVVCVLTSAYPASRWCAAEVEIARSRGSRLLPIRAEPGVVDPALESVQHIDMARDPAAAQAELVAVLHPVDAAGGLGWPDDRSPFPGLHPFDVDQHRMFFGRDEERKELAELLRAPAVRAGGTALLVVGPSGCGKSSLVRAGLLPVMAGEPGWWTLAPVVPGADPVTALARELATTARRIGLGWTVAQVRQQVDDGGLVGLADELLLAAPGGPQRRLLIVADQFEELLTQTAPLERARFVELLRPALAGPVQLVATLRSEFLDQLLTDPTVGGIATHTYTLRPLGRAGLRAAIERPARLAGIEVETALVDRLVEDTDTGEALPLLAFTLAQLAEGIGRGGQLSATRYDQLGGVRGALTRQADAALAAAVTAGGRREQEVIAGLLGLVTVDEQGRPTRWRARRDELPRPVVTELGAFVECRLLTTDDANGSGVVIGVTHEAFLSAWPRLHEAIIENASALRARRAIDHAATAWHDHDRPPVRLWGGGHLAAAVADTGAHIGAGSVSPTAAPPPAWGAAHWLPHRNRVLVADRIDLNPAARDFLHASIRRDRYRRWRIVTVLSVLLVLALVGAGIAVIQQQAAQEQQRLATARQLIAQADTIRDTNPRTALQLGIAAQHIHPSNETQSSLVKLLANTRYAGTLTGHTGSVFSVVFAPHGHILASADSGDGDGGAVILWDLTDPAQPQRLGQPLTGHTGAVASVAFAPDGRTLASAGTIDGVILWDLTDPAQPQRLGQPLTVHPGPVLSVGFAPDGRTLATTDSDGAVILWDLTDPAQPQRLGQPLTGHTGPVYLVAFAPDGRTLATAGDIDGAVILWDLTDPAQPQRLGQPLTGHTGSVLSVAFAPDGRTLVTTGDDGAVSLWDLTALNDLRNHAVERACSVTERGLDRDEWARYVSGLPYQDTCRG
ncbi:MAG: TIR domain-containing protein [Actinomycetota bacterium]|nr:TIR domain-containing protein [Actinomycetota bacterium]